MGKEKPRNIEFSEPNSQMLQEINKVPSSFVRYLFRSFVLGVGYVGSKGIMAMALKAINRKRSRR